MLHKTLAFLFIVLVCSSIFPLYVLAQQEERKPVPGVSVEKGGALLPTGRFVLEPAFQYAHNSSKQLVSISGFSIFNAILIGRIDLKEIERDIYIPSITARLGFKDMELNVKVPWMYRKDKETNPAEAGATVYSADDSGLGDIEGGFYYRLVNEHGAVPDIILSLGVKSDTGRDPYGLQTETVGGQLRYKEFPTGTGHWGYSGGLIFVKTTDPAIVFLNLTYFYNDSRDIGTENGTCYGEVDPGDSFEYNIGTVVALNEKFSMNFTLNQRITGKTVQNGSEIADSDLNAISFNLGGTYAISKRFSVDMTAGIGLTSDANDVTLLLRIPINFEF
ncbi:MAG: transporter [Thermodesulfobacteriota bacterium]